jgi:flagellar motor switch protein FliM
VTTNVSAEEVRAIQDLARPDEGVPDEVRVRDFTAPRRHSAAHLAKLARAAQASLEATESHLSIWLHSAHKVEIAAVVEADARSIVGSLVDPFSVLAFDAAGQVGFVVWEMSALIAAIETALGSIEVKDAKPRPLSSVETKVLALILTRVAELVSTSLGVTASKCRIMSDALELARWEEAPGADAQRIGVQLAIDGPAGASTLRVYVPGVKPETATASTPAKPAKTKALPAHLAALVVEVRAEVGAVDVRLQDLLALEVGDVLRLPTKIGDLLRVRAEGETCAYAELGQHEGRTVLRIHSIEGRNATGSRG